MDELDPSRYLRAPDAPRPGDVENPWNVVHLDPKTVYPGRLAAVEGEEVVVEISLCSASRGVNVPNAARESEGKKLVDRITHLVECERKLKAVREHAEAMGYETVLGIIDCPHDEPTHGGNECAMCDRPPS